MAKLNVVSVNNQGAGVNDLFFKNEIKSNESPTNARNIRLDGKSKRTREGYTTFGDAQTGGTDIKGLASYRRSLAANDRLIMNYNATLYSIDPDSTNTWTSITNTITSDSFMNFANYKDWLFCFNGVDEPGLLEGTTYDDTVFTKPDSMASLAVFVPAFGEVYLKSLWVSGVPTAPNTVFISKPATTDTPASIYDFSGALEAGAADEILLPTRVTAIKQMATLAIVFTVDEAFYVDGFKDLGSAIVPNLYPINGASGAINHQSTVVVENDIYYLTPQNEIKSVRRGFADSVTLLVNPISDKIRKFLQENLDADQSSAFGYYDQTKKLYKLFVKSKGSTINDIRIVADIKKLDQNGNPEWLIDDAMAFSSGVFFKDKAYIGSDVIGQVYRDENGFADDDDAAINSYWSTKDFTADNPSTLKRYKDITIFGQITETTSITATVLVDDTEVIEVTIDSNDIVNDEEGGIGVQTIGEFAIGDDEVSENTLKEFVKRIPFRHTGKKISINFTTSDINQDYRISYLQYSFIALSPLFNPVSEKL